MDKVLKRAQQASRAAERKFLKRKKFIKNGDEWQKRMQLQAVAKAERKLLKDERYRRQEAWKRGPLTPRPDVGRYALEYGTIPSGVVNLPDEFEKNVPDWFHIQAGDRVVIVAGRGKGTVAEVEYLNEEKCSVTVKGNTVNVLVPDKFRAETGGRAIVPQSLPVPLKNVKLVFALPDPKTGIPKDTIIERVDPIGREWDRHQRKLGKGFRVVHGTDIVIPWPEMIEEEDPVYDIDTRVNLVEEQTFVPTLIVSPMPTNLINELRGEHAVFRTRLSDHQKAKIARREQRDLDKQELVKTMRTPLQELAALREEQRAQRKQELSSEQMARLGEIMAATRISGQAATTAPS